jgi:hypothetical protein
MGVTFDAAEFVQALNSQGVTMIAKDGRVGVKPRSKASKEQLEALREHKEEILAFCAVRKRLRLRNPETVGKREGFVDAGEENQSVEGFVDAVVDLSTPPRPCPSCAAPIAWRHDGWAVTCYCRAEPPPGLEKVVLIDVADDRHWVNFDDEFGTDEDRIFFDFDGELWIWCEQMPEEFEFPDEKPSEYRGLIGCGFPPVPTKEPPPQIISGREIAPRQNVREQRQHRSE